SAAAQVGATTDIITGRVTGPDSQPLAGAVVVATSVETRVSHQRTSDASGRFTIVFPDGGGRYELTARFIGMAAVQVTVARQSDEDRIVADIRMGLAAVPLEPVTVSARSSARSDRTGPGGSDRNYNPEQLARRHQRAARRVHLRAARPLARVGRGHLVAVRPGHDAEPAGRGHGRPHCAQQAVRVRGTAGPVARPALALARERRSRHARVARG